MPDDLLTVPNQRLRTPRAAAVAGIVFAVLFGSSMVLIRVSVPADPEDGGGWIKDRASAVSLALSLVPFAGIAFLWFMGVVRDRIGHREDRFFSTVFVGAGLLFLAMTFVSAALAGSVLATYGAEHRRLIDSGVYAFVRELTHRITSLYAAKMAGVFMISLATLWLRTGAMPRWVSLLSFVLAAGLLLGIGSSLWVTLIFPFWVCAVSVYVLASNLPTPAASPASWKHGEPPET